MSLESEVAELTTVTTELLTAVNVSKNTLDAAVATSSASSAIAEASAAQIQFITALYLGAL